MYSFKEYWDIAKHHTMQSATWPFWTGTQPPTMTIRPLPHNSGQDNEQSDKKGGRFHRHRKVWRILSDGELDFVPQQRRVSARRNVILSSVWWLTWIDSKSVSTVCLHMIIVHEECGVKCASQDSKLYSIKIRTFLPTTKEKGVYCQLRSSDSPNLQV